MLLTCDLQPIAFFPLIWHFLPGHLHKRAYEPHLSAPWIWLIAFLGSVTCHQSVNVLKSICEHSRKHHAEKCWCHNTALFDSVSHRKWFRVLSIILNACLHGVMKLPQHYYVLGGQPNVAIIFQSSSRLTVSNVLVRSTKVMYRSIFCSWHFSCSCLAVKIMSIVPLSFLEPH